ncbi:MAG: DNA alkylation repair protein [Candidatus Cloacimonadaceae bacterium]|jgi:3-methyladenine DNA glycosylase AlkC|nr:DNA alkylation repair protein [Candidatus Cloacimonadota bacterium]MDY0128137.1 DNA alkylation repair protein [Candidatus Cloacimonadaceae bacterium]MCB5255771.1 DNA alkylation repair protein [Candidatus Cloacimonadota bacterium]MCK9178433.1 DNA alkylation repair protein [Candidatus Cloacimonadota bacterium]MCK9242695.1 DNA alkylation repair protein [Candidatus Cloacimonadota bacterium]
MIKEVGRLNIDDYKILDAQVEKIFLNLDKKKPDQAIKLIMEMGNTANYFVREELGKRLAVYTGKGNLDKICGDLLEDFIYGVRATGLFYFYYKYQESPEHIIKTLEKTFETVPWESETICFEMWKNFPDAMREHMPLWAESDNEKKRAISMHGMENVASRNPQFVLMFVGRLLDDESEEVQKKISHILTQVGRVRPIQTYTNVRRWLIDADEARFHTIWQTLRKLANIFTQKSKRDHGSDFMSITQRTVQEWRKDKNPNVQNMGNKLGSVVRMRNKANARK